MLSTNTQRLGYSEYRFDSLPIDFDPYGVPSITQIVVRRMAIGGSSPGLDTWWELTLNYPPVASVGLPDQAPVQVGHALQLTPTILDAMGNELTGRPTEWSSTNPAVATVSQTGLVTGFAVGTAAISVMSNGHSATTSVSVTAQPPLGAPSGLVVERTASSDARLTWTPGVIGNGVVTEIQRSDNGGPFILVATVPSVYSSVTVSGQTDGHTYGYHVRHRSAGNTSANSPTATLEFGDLDPWIWGPTYVKNGTSQCMWEGYTVGGSEPYTYSWRLNGSAIGTGSTVNFAAYPNFVLELNVRSGAQSRTTTFGVFETTGQLDCIYVPT